MKIDSAVIRTPLDMVSTFKKVLVDLLVVVEL